MLIVEYKNGAWGEPVIKPYENISISPAAQVLHYGQAIFEGMKAYREADQIYLFRVEDNFRRMNDSAIRLMMPELPKEIFVEGLQELVSLDRDWIPTNEGGALYLRPFMFASEPMLRANPSAEFMFIILCSPVQSYYSEPLKVKFPTIILVLQAEVWAMPKRLEIMRLLFILHIWHNKKVLTKYCGRMRLHILLSRNLAQ